MVPLKPESDQNVEDNVVLPTWKVFISVNLLIISYNQEMRK